MKSFLNILFAALAFSFTMTIAYLAKSDIVMQAVMLAFLIQWVAYIPAYIFQTEKFYDLTGSLSYLTVIWFVFFSSNNLSGLNIQNLIVVTLISVWAIRLGTFLFGRIHKDGEDKRFRTIKTSASQFFMTWTLQGMWVSICTMCAITAISSSQGIIANALFYLGLAFFIVGFAIEVVSDQQKSAFRAVPENKEKFITSGLWSKSQHPNYFGEILLWSAIALLSISSLNGTQYLTLISPIFTYVLLVYISGVRMLDDMGNKKWGHLEEYKEYKRNTPTLFLKL
jgi:steroid 5-alpha reductase family enzyme|tara:strand:- start:4041 stop:4886 length:846 start_codon:yes stop_codon:yes gene_type:complete